MNAVLDVIPQLKATSKKYVSRIKHIQEND